MCWAWQAKEIIASLIKHNATMGWWERENLCITGCSFRALGIFCLEDVQGPNTPLFTITYLVRWIKIYLSGPMCFIACAAWVLILQKYSVLTLKDWWPWDCHRTSHAKSGGSSCVHRYLYQRVDTSENHFVLLLNSFPALPRDYIGISYKLAVAFAEDNYLSCKLCKFLPHPLQRSKWQIIQLFNCSFLIRP